MPRQRPHRYKKQELGSAYTALDEQEDYLVRQLALTSYSADRNLLEEPSRWQLVGIATPAFVRTCTQAAL